MCRRHRAKANNSPWWVTFSVHLTQGSEKVHHDNRIYDCLVTVNQPLEVNDLCAADWEGQITKYVWCGNPGPLATNSYRPRDQLTAAVNQAAGFPRIETGNEVSSWKLYTWTAALHLLGQNNDNQARFDAVTVLLVKIQSVRIWRLCISV